jgi:hypothetical protein
VCDALGLVPGSTVTLTEFLTWVGDVPPGTWDGLEKEFADVGSRQQSDSQPGSFVILGPVGHGSEYFWSQYRALASVNALGLLEVYWGEMAVYDADYKGLMARMPDFLRQAGKTPEEIAELQVAMIPPNKRGLDASNTPTSGRGHGGDLAPATASGVRGGGGRNGPGTQSQGMPASSHAASLSASQGMPASSWDLHMYTLQNKRAMALVKRLDPARPVLRCKMKLEDVERCVLSRLPFRQGHKWTEAEISSMDLNGDGQVCMEELVDAAITNKRFLTMDDAVEFAGHLLPVKKGLAITAREQLAVIEKVADSARPLLQGIDPAAVVVYNNTEVLLKDSGEAVADRLLEVIFQFNAYREAGTLEGQAGLNNGPVAALKWMRDTIDCEPCMLPTVPQVTDFLMCFVEGLLQPYERLGSRAPKLTCQAVQCALWY